MKQRHMRLALGLFFLVAGVTLLVIRFTMPEVAAKISTPMRLLIGSLLALVLAGVNLGKWYASWLWFHQQATPVHRPLQPDPESKRDEEYNPEFDFDKREK